MSVRSAKTAIDRRPIIVSVAPNGARRGKRDHPRLPMTAAEIAADAMAAHAAGAAMLHVHVRNSGGEHTLHADGYRQALAAIRAGVADRMILQITTEAVGRYGPEDQMAMVREVRPEAVSLALRELCPDPGHELPFSRFVAFLRREHILPQIILYDTRDVARLLDLIDRGIVPGPPPVLFVLGRYQTNDPARPADLAAFLGAAGGRLPDFMVCAFGANEAACCVAGALFGGDVRVGFENNLRLPNGDRAPDNAALVSAVRKPLAALGYALATADDIRSRHAM
jgi:uncharacterized protein (DUF849 family)